MTAPMKNRIEIGKKSLEEQSMLPFGPSDQMTLHARDHYGRNLLYYTIKNDNFLYSITLIDEGIPLMVTSEKHALFWAIACHDFRLFAYLLSKGLSVNMRNDKEQTLLMYAIAHHKNLFVKYLMNLGCSLYLFDEAYDLAIDYAKRHKNSEALQLISAAYEKEVKKFQPNS